jgi:integrase
VPPHTRRLLGLLHDMVTTAQAESIERNAYRFTRKTGREFTGWGDPQLKVHLHRLVELEYLLAHGGRGHGLVYELLYDVRFIQEMLGHSDLSSTQVYTQVTITKPKEMHSAAKLARKVDAQDDVGADQAGLLAQLDVEAEEGGTARPGPG